MPFTNAHHGGADEPADLAARIDAELRGRIEDAVDFACLDAMVREREARGEPAPAPDDARAREEYGRRVVSFLERVRVTLTADLTDEQRARLGPHVRAPQPGDVAAALAVQVALAKALPDYWQRFDAVRLTPGSAASGNAASGRESRRLIDWLLGR
jgi:hypothetical protein